MPEELYTESVLPVITPHNVVLWLKAVLGAKVRVLLQEFMSGSGRLSLGVFLTNNFVCFPVDFRYSWDLGISEHQVLLRQVDDAMKMFVHFYESKILQYKRDQILREGADRGLLFETLPSSLMLTISPISGVITHPGWHKCS